MSVLYTEKSNGFTLIVDFDEVCDYDFEPLTTFILKKSVVSFPSCEDIEEILYDGWEDDYDENTEDCIRDMFSLRKGIAVYLAPLYGYKHGGLSLSLAPFGCRFDSGLTGYVVLFEKDAELFENIVKTTPDNNQESYEKIVQSEVDCLQSLCNGELYVWCITDQKGEVVDCCAGYSNQNNAVEDGKIALQRLSETS